MAACSTADGSAAITTVPCSCGTAICTSGANEACDAATSTCAPAACSTTDGSASIATVPCSCGTTRCTSGENNEACYAATSTCAAALFTLWDGSYFQDSSSLPCACANSTCESADYGERGYCDEGAAVCIEDCQAGSFKCVTYVTICSGVKRYPRKRSPDANPSSRSRSASPWRRSERALSLGALRWMRCTCRTPFGPSGPQRSRAARRFRR